MKRKAAVEEEIHDELREMREKREKNVEKAFQKEQLARWDGDEEIRKKKKKEREEKAEYSE